MKTVVHSFNKRPSAKNLANRSISFSDGETDHVKQEDDLEIVVKFPTGSTTVYVTGEKFLSSLADKTMKDGTKIKVFRF